MAHVIIFRTSQSMTQGKELIYGVDEQEEFEISKRRYPVESFRKGYNKPFASTWRMRDYRLKKEIAGKFVKDAGALNLNPSPNNMTLAKVLRLKRTNRTATLGRGLEVIQLLFKWINQKWLSSSILLGIWILSFIFNLHLIGLIPTTVIIALLFLNPLKPVPVEEDYTPQKFTRHWKYAFCFGMLEDVEEIYGHKNEYMQEDVL